MRKGGRGRVGWITGERKKRSEKEMERDERSERGERK